MISSGPTTRSPPQDQELTARLRTLKRQKVRRRWARTRMVGFCCMLHAIRADPAGPSTRIRYNRTQAQEVLCCSPAPDIPQEPGDSPRRSSELDLRLVRFTRGADLSSALRKAVSHPPKGKYSYITAAAPPSRSPPLQLCSVCGYKGKYGCQRCGLRYCDLGCKGIHDESRCERR